MPYLPNKEDVKGITDAFGWGAKVLGALALTVIIVVFIAIPASLAKGSLDTFIVVCSLISLIFGNLLKCKPEWGENTLEYILKFLKFLKKYLLWGIALFLLELLFGKMSARTDDVMLVLIGLIIITILAILICFFENSRQRIHLLFALWWVYILSLYLWKVFS